MAASGPKATALAGLIAEGFISTSPDSDLTENFRKEAGETAECIGQLTVCVADSRD